MNIIEIDNLPSQDEINSYAENDIVLVYDKNVPQIDAKNSQRILYPVTHQFVVKTDTSNEIKKILYPIQKFVVKDASANQ